MSFYLVKLVPDPSNPGQMIDEPIPGAGPYQTGPQAAAAAKAAQASHSDKVQPRRMRQAGDWRPRVQEQINSISAIYQLPHKWDLPPIKDHFAHIDPLGSNTIRFIESEEMGVIGRFTLLSAGRYISRFFLEVDDAHRRRLIAAVDPSGEVFFATSPEDIAEIYKVGPASCMDDRKGRKELWAHLPIWPPAVYGAGDLAVAYTKNERGSIQSRALCWPDKKLFGRCYGDIQRMEAAMKAEGFKDVRQYGNGSYAGARLLKIPGPKDHTFMIPYFDDIEKVYDAGDHFVVMEEDIGIPAGVKFTSGDTGGCAFLQMKCPKEDTAHYVHTFVFVNGANEEWSRTAAGYHARECDATKQWFTKDLVVPMIGGKFWSKAHFDEHGAVCEYSHVKCPKSEMVLLDDGRAVHSSKVSAATQTATQSRNYPWGVDVGGNDYTSYHNTFRGQPQEMFAAVQQAFARQMDERMLMSIVSSVTLATANPGIAPANEDNEVNNAA